MATRLYPNNAAAGVTPSSWSAGWNVTTSAATSTLDGHRSTSGLTANLAGTGTSGQFRALHRLVSPALKAQTIDGTFAGVFQCHQASATDDYTIAVGIKVIQSDGSDRGTLLSVVGSDDPATYEFTITGDGIKNFRDVSEGTSISLSSLAVSDGDRIVVEIGFLQGSTSTNNGQCTVYQSSRGDGIDDLTTTENSTTAGIPWVEFSADIKFQEPFFLRALSIPEDVAASSGGTNSTSPTTFTQAQLAPARQGDLIVADQHTRSNTAPAISAPAGQTWTSEAEQNLGTTNYRVRNWCTFDGTWDTDLSLTTTDTVANSCQVLIFRAEEATDTWEQDVAQAETEDTASPYGPAAVTTVADEVIVVASWGTADNNSWSNVSGAGWIDIGSAQYRNLASQDMSDTYAYYWAPTGGTNTGAPTKTQTALGADDTMCLTQAYKRVAAAVAPVFGWFKEFVEPTVRAAGLAAALSVTSGFAWAPQVVAPPPEAPAFGWYKEFVQAPVKGPQIAGSIDWNPQRIGDAVPAPSYGWHVQRENPVQARPRTVIAGGVIWDAQRIGDAVPAPEFGWYKPSDGTQQPKPVTKVLGSIAWDAQASFSLTATPTQFGWYVPFSTSAPKTNINTGQVAWDPQPIGDQVPAPAYGWRKQFQDPPQVTITKQGRIAWTPQATFSLTATPSDLGWLQPFGTAKVTTHIAGNIAWAPHAIGEVQAELPFGWYRGFETPRQTAISLLPGMAWSPRQIGDHIPAPPFGWYVPLDGTRQSRPTTQIAGSIDWTAQATFSLTATPTQFGWYVPFGRSQPTTQIAGQISWDPQAVAAFPTLTTDFDWHVPFPSLKAPKPVLAGGIWWDPQQIGDAVPAPAFGWYQSFAPPSEGSRRSKVALLDGSAAPIGQGLTAPATAPAFGWYVAFDQPRLKASTTFLADGFTRSEQEPAAPPPAPVFGWYIPWTPIATKNIVSALHAGFTSPLEVVPPVPPSGTGPLYIRRPPSGRTPFMWKGRPT